MDEHGIVHFCLHRMQNINYLYHALWCYMQSLQNILLMSNIEYLYLIQINHIYFHLNLLVTYY